nr:hypothetical protein [uncultured Nocardioides sp.]
MSTDIDWQHELDSSFGTGNDVPPGHYVAAGRTAVRRRRATAAVLALALVICGGAAWASGQGSMVRGDAPVATQGSDSQQDVTEPDGVSERLDKRVKRLARMRQQAEKPDFLGEPATLDADGLVLAPGAGPVLERVENPMGYTAAQGQSLGIRVMFEGREKYSLLTRNPDGDTSMGTNDATGDFAGWLDGRVASQRYLDVANGVTGAPPTTTDTDPARWLRLRPDGDVVAGEGAVLLEVRATADLGDFALGADRAAAVRVLVDEVARFAAYRVVDGSLEVVAAPGSFDSMSAFVDWARDQYSSGKGMR